MLAGVYEEDSSYCLYGAGEVSGGYSAGEVLYSYASSYEVVEDVCVDVAGSSASPGADAEAKAY